MHQLTSLIRYKSEVYLSRSVTPLSESGSRVPHDTTKSFSQFIRLCRKLTALFNELSLLAIFFIFHSKVLRYFSRIFTILADFQPETSYILTQFADKVALEGWSLTKEGRGFRPKFLVRFNLSATRVKAKIPKDFRYAQAVFRPQLTDTFTQRLYELVDGTLGTKNRNSRSDAQC